MKWPQYEDLTSWDLKNASGFIFLLDEYQVPDCTNKPEPMLEVTEEEDIELQKRLKQACAKVSAKTGYAKGSEKVPLKMKGTFDLQLFGDRHWNEITVAIFGGGLLAFLKIAKTLLIQWLKNRSSRSIKIKTGRMELVIKGSATSKEIDDMLTLLSQHQEAQAIGPASKTISISKANPKTSTKAMKKQKPKTTR